VNTINVVGAGIAGSLVARVLRARGHTVRVIDDCDVNSASRASSNLYIGSWLKKFGSPAASNGIRVVEELFAGKIDQPFSRGIADAARVRHIAQRHLLVDPDVVGTATSVHQVDDPFPPNYGGGVKVSVLGGRFFPGRTVICTGYRGAELVPGLKVDVKVGHGIHFRGRLPEGKSSLTLASPYTHAKLYQLDEDTIYFADSVAVTRGTYDKRRKELMDRTMARAVKLIGFEPEVKSILVGYRPFVSGHDFGYLAQVKPGVWVLNGGGKNGIVAYADAADRLAKEIGS
jgi:glycine/D-amino acid oxidase-like deaminating enzyme